MSIGSGVKSLALLLGSTFRVEIDALQLRAYNRALADIADDVLLEAGDRLVVEAASGRRFYPVPTAADVKRHAAAIIAERRKHAAARALADCQHDSGWETFTDEDGFERVKRCDCWRASRAAMARIGQPIALPASTSEEVTE